LDSSLSLFDNVAEMGAEAAIEKMRNQLVTELDKDRERYFDSNANRNPFKNVEFYAIPFAIAAASWILAVIVDKTCSTDICEVMNSARPHLAISCSLQQAEDGFQNIYLFIFFCFILFTWKRIAGSWDYLKEILPLLINSRIGGGNGGAAAAGLAMLSQQKKAS
jgi:hypothetical protein